MIVPRFVLRVLALCALAGPCLQGGEEEKPKVLDLLPAGNVAVLDLPDASALRKAMAGSDFGALWAEPEMQMFCAPIVKALQEQLAGLQAGNPMVPTLEDLSKILGGGLAISVAMGPAGPRICVALDVKDVPTAAKLLAPLLQGKELADGLETTLGPPEFPGPALAFEKGILFFSTVKDELGAMKARLGDAAKRKEAAAKAEGWDQARKLMGEGHLRVFVSAPVLVQLAMAQAGPEAEKIQKTYQKSGLDGVGGVVLQVGSRGSLLAMDMGLVLKGEPRGVISQLAGGAPIPAAALKHVPAEATFVSVGRTSLKDMLEMVRGLLDEEELKEFNTGLVKLGDELGMDLEKDLLPAIGDTWVTYDVGTQEFLGMLPGMAVSVDVKDAAKAEKLLETLIGKAESLIAAEAGGGFGGGPEVELRQVKMGETVVHYLSISMMPFSPAAAVVKDRLLVTLSVNGMRQALRHLEAGKDITGTAGFKEALERVTGKPLDLAALPAQFSYSCPGKHTAPYGMLAQLGQWFTGIFKMQMNMRAAWGGAPDPGQQKIAEMLDHVDFALFPSDQTVLKHVRPTAAVMVKGEGGLIYRNDIGVPSFGSIGSGQAGLYTVPVIAAIAIPNLLRSRMAANESAAIAACKTYAEAQDIYRRTDWDGDAVLEYAQAIKGENSLYEKTAGQGDLQLVDQAFANAAVTVTQAHVKEEDLPEPSAEDKAAFEKLLAKLSSDDFNERETATDEMEQLGAGVTKLLLKAAKESKDIEARQRCKRVADKLSATLAREKGAAAVEKGQPKAGYHFKVLTGQGKSAPGGEKSYVTNGNMTLGYALLAYPAEYDETGRNTFLINNTGTVYQRDLGEDTVKIAEEMETYNPDEGWVVAE